MHLPKSVTLAAPVSALYGYRYSIGGTGRAGDAVSLESLATNGLVPARGATMVKPDGTFVIRATLRSVFTDDGDLALAAGGRYARRLRRGRQRDRLRHRRPGHARHPRAAALRAAAQDRWQAPALLHPHPGRRRARAHRDQARQQDARDRLLDEERHVLEDDREALPARQPPRGRLGARRRHGDLERDTAQPPPTTRSGPIGVRHAVWVPDPGVLQSGPPS